MSLKNLAIFAVACASAWTIAEAQSRPLTTSVSDLLFRDSNLYGARAKAARGFKERPNEIDALFVEMEGSALAGDTAAELNAAIRLCDTRTADPRAAIAAARILDLAANSSAFRKIAPRVRALANSKSIHVNYFRLALLKAANDGLPGDSVHDRARQAGLPTEWRLAGPYGRFGNVDFERAWPPEREGLDTAALAERFAYDDGNVSPPEYFARSGAYYGTAELTTSTSGQYLVRVESAGTLAIAIDGNIAVRKDDRFRASPNILAAPIRLNAGRHAILVKFLPSASPFRVAVVPDVAALPAQNHRGQGWGSRSNAESDYVAAALRYWSGDYSSAIALLKHSDVHSVAAQFLLAQAWTQEKGSEAPEVIDALQAALAASPQAVAAETMLAEAAYAAERVDEAIERVRRALAARPDFLPAQELMAEIAIHFHWHREATQAIAARVGLHPDCATLRDAVKFFSSSSQFERAAEMEQKLNGCSPSSLAYVEALADAGRHREAAAAAAAKVAERPLDRDARYLLVRELRLAGDFGAATKAAAELARLAPNSEHFRRLAAGPVGQVEDDEGRATGFDSSDTFYAPFRREALDILARTGSRKFSGGPAVILLHDKVVRFEPDGAASVYVHKITRLLTRDGVERYGEVAVPDGSDLLELRTLKADGSVAEPDFLQHKNTVSMPALAPDDAIEQEYVTRYPAPATAEHPEVFRFVFGSFDAPILFSRFAVLSPHNAVQPSSVSDGVPAPLIKNGGALRIWEKNDIPQSLEEIAMPRGDNLPTVHLLPLATDAWQPVRDYYRDIAITATRIGSRVQGAAAAMSGDNGERKTRAMYRLVTSRIGRGNRIWGAGLSSAEETLASGEGSRMATLLALARATGVHADLVLAREVGAELAQARIEAYSYPLVRFVTAKKVVFADPEADGLMLGAITPALDPERALLVPLTPSNGPMFVPLASRADQERSVADADLKLNREGDLAADLTITMGASRSAQMRSVLRGIPASGRRHFFEQLALRIFPGAGEVKGNARGEEQPDQPLVLHVVCRSPRFVIFNGQTADLDQLAPALNLRKLYVGPSPRRFGLLIDMPLFESATFRLHLPPEARLLHRPDDLEERTRFGDYALRFRELRPDLLEIARSFRIPVQLLPASQYGEFAQFAIRIDDAERQRLTLELSATTAWRSEKWKVEKGKHQ